MKKNAFSLVEILVSIMLFSIIIIFLYHTLDISIKSNQFYSTKLSDKQKRNNIKKILFLDLINSENLNKNIIQDTNKNTILSIQSNNTYHNPFYTNITYLLTSKDNFIRVESKKKFNTKELNEEFFKDAYIDILDKSVHKLKIKEKGKKYYFYIEYKDKTKVLFKF